MDERVPRVTLAAVATPSTTSRSDRVNVSSYVREMARSMPFARAVIVPGPRNRSTGKRAYYHQTFLELEREIDRLVRGLTALGVKEGMRTLMLVRPGFEFFAFSFALFRLGAVPVMVDPGMGRERVLGAINEAEPEAMISIPRGHVARVLFPSSFRSVKIKVTLGRFGGTTLEDLRALGSSGGEAKIAETRAHDPAAILFTSGSTGAPKGAIYTQGIFDEQVRIFREELGIRAGEVDLSAFPLFSLFSTALGVSVVVPDMDASRPGAVNPSLITESIADLGVTYAFGSPAFWLRVADHCEEKRIVLSSMRRILMAGAPAPPALLERLVRLAPKDSEVFTPYGATESLPISLPSARALSGVLGTGTCVGRPLSRVEVRIIAINDEPVNAIEELPRGEIGEIIVRSPTTTHAYFRRDTDNSKSKIKDGDSIWHRMGDVGRLDEEGRLWFCGRKSHRVETSEGTLFTEPVEAVFNRHPRVFRSALVGVGPRGRQRPVIIVELKPGVGVRNRAADDELRAELLHLAQGSAAARAVKEVLFHRALPVDPRHNAKIIREELALWAAAQQK